ncbi:copper resistance system multicopper oxidase [Gimibacter soli]|uniref:Copper resistance system multicopper oxidase n=1 Tax=Gimibacter soli TaxID=3024400 RepID=A0AAF0BKV2_9PROT|nr:copper resistance system multicopper oxidase [Gimibacter soli]WCL53372.1 copper resistance system multicopper oxidase [Gimibacter soli]
MINRRHFLIGASQVGLMTALGASLPAWARSSADGNMGITTLEGRDFNLTIDRFPVTIDGRRGRAVGVNGTLPAPLLRFREGEDVTLRVTNRLKEDTSIHWHGLLLPFEMDGVPGVTFDGIKPGETFTYHFPVRQSGTYWYHSHSGLQEQDGLYGPLVIDPAGADPVAYDREYVLVLSDWTFEGGDRVFAKLKKVSDTYNMGQRTLGDFFRDVSDNGLDATLRDRREWGEMRMSPRDISDTSAMTYEFLINGHTTGDNWNGVFKAGEKVRLRIINASAMTIFNVRMPDLPMTVVAADGLNVQPLETDEFQMGVAETYDVIIEPKEDRAYAFVAESIDRSGQAVATFGPRPGMRAEAPALRKIPTLTMKDMGMDHGAMGHGNMGGMDHSTMDHSQMNHATMDHGQMDHSTMDHSKMGHAQPDEGQMDHAAMGHAPAAKPLKTGPGVDNIATMPVSRLHEPGLGLEDVPHRTLRYSQLRSLDPIPDRRQPERELDLHLTGNMERYMWSFDGIKYTEVKGPIIFKEGERLRLHLTNDTMMSHPIHLHGMFFELNNEGGDHRPRKHTVIVKPGEKLSFDVTADALGNWAFHCHLLYHMHAGMMRVVQVQPRNPGEVDHSTMDHSKMDHSKMGHNNMNHGEHNQ